MRAEDSNKLADTPALINRRSNRNAELSHARCLLLNVLPSASAERLAEVKDLRSIQKRTKPLVALFGKAGWNRGSVGTGRPTRCLLPDRESAQEYESMRAYIRYIVRSIFHLLANKIPTQGS